MTIIRNALVCGICAILVGCRLPEQQDREILSSLKTIKDELATNRPSSIRWAFADRRVIESAIESWSQEQIEKAMRAEVVSAEEAEKLKQYETLSNELGRMQYPNPTYINHLGLPMTSGIDTNKQSEYDALSARVAQARVPVASVLDRRDREAERIRKQFTPDELTAEYVGDRFDLVVDSSDSNSYRTVLLYRSSGEAVDITDGILKLFKQKTKQ